MTEADIFAVIAKSQEFEQIKVYYILVYTVKVLQKMELVLISFMLLCMYYFCMCVCTSSKPKRV